MSALATTKKRAGTGLKRTFRTYENYLSDALKDKTGAVEYLKAALDDEDPRVFLLALRDVIAASEITMTELAKKTGISRENLYKVVSLNGNPNWRNIHKILSALGFRFDISVRLEKVKKTS
jgi:probable addiction module antidote protein